MNTTSNIEQERNSIIEDAKAAGFRIHSKDGVEFISADSNYPDLTAQIKRLIQLQAARQSNQSNEPVIRYGLTNNSGDIFETTDDVQSAYELLERAGITDNISDHIIPICKANQSNNVPVANNHTWALKQIADLDPKNGSIGTAVFMAKEALASPPNNTSLLEAAEACVKVASSYPDMSPESNAALTCETEILALIKEPQGQSND